MSDPGRPLVAGQIDLRAGGLHPVDLPGDRALQVDVVAGALEHLAAALRLLHEPRPAGRRAHAVGGEQAERIGGGRSGQIG